MGKGRQLQQKNSQPKHLPDDAAPLSSDSSDAEDASSNTANIKKDQVSVRHESPVQVELESEDSVTCQWEDCGILFTHLPTLIDHIHNEHIGVHKSNYTCEWSSCLRRGLPQTSRFALISHIRSHTGEKPFICPLPECDKSFTRSDALAKHMRLQHNLVPPAPGRGGARKRKRGAEEGFTTFKVDPTAITDQFTENQGGGIQGLQEHIASSSTTGKGSANGKGKAQKRPLPQIRQTPSPDVQPPPDIEEEGYTSTLDLLPDYLRPHYDDSTGLMMGKPKSKVMYLLMKAKYRYAMEQHENLSDQLKDVRAELDRLKTEKESALDELLRQMLGPEANILISSPLPPEVSVGSPADSFPTESVPTLV